MKLPEDKKERTQILVLIMIGLVAVIYAGFQLHLNMITKPKKNAEKEISRLEGELSTAANYIGTMESDKAQSDKIIAELSSIHSQYILKPRLGDNYLLSAQEIIEEHEHAMEIDAEITDIGMADIPQKTTTPKDFAFKTYTVRVQFKEGLHKTIEFLKAVEKSNPYFCICNLNIVAQKDIFDKHEVSFDVQWPIWVMNDLTSQAMQILKRNTDSSKSKPVTTAPSQKETKKNTPAPVNTQGSEGAS